MHDIRKTCAVCAICHTPHRITMAILREGGWYTSRRTLWTLSSLLCSPPTVHCISTATTAHTMAVALINTRADKGWEQELRKQAPHLDIRVWPDRMGPPNTWKDIHHAIVCHPPLESLTQLPNLQTIHSLWAGVEHVVHPMKHAPSTTPGLERVKQVPLFRLVDPDLTQGMVDYCVGHVYRYHLELPQWEAIRTQGIWNTGHTPPPLVQDRRIGVMGLGALGSAVARQLIELGFSVSAWSRTGHTRVEGLTASYASPDLQTFLSQCDIVVLLLPNTSATTHICNRTTLAWLPRGAALINAGRGNAIDETALLEALDTGHVRGATLDVFVQEPLPVEHPFWKNSHVYVTPHVASVTRVESAIRTVLATMRTLHEGTVAIPDIPGWYNPERGY
jgi:glyoxylate/hydroxypyruvate reductase